MANKHTNSIQLQRALGAPCEYCKRTMCMTKPGLTPTRDHVWPRSQGGKFTVWACYACNHIKSDMTPEEWREFMLAFPKWWGGIPREHKRELSTSKGRHMPTARQIEQAICCPNGCLRPEDCWANMDNAVQRGAVRAIQKLLEPRVVPRRPFVIEED